MKRLKIIVALLLAVFALPAEAQAPTQEEIIQELIGAPVLSADGREVGLSIRSLQTKRAQLMASQ